MAQGCRDCSQCIEPWAKGFVMGVFRLMWKLCFGWNIGLFMSKCPQCGHFMKKHARRADGSFKD